MKINASLPGRTSPLSRLPYQEFNLIQHLAEQAKANYNSLGVKLERNFKQGLTYWLGYTFSRVIILSSAVREHRLGGQLGVVGNRMAAKIHITSRPTAGSPFSMLPTAW